MNDRVIHINLSTVILLCITLVVLFLSTKSCGTKPLDLTRQKQQLDSISKVIHHLQSQQHKLDGVIVNHQHSIDSINISIDKTQQNILNIRSYYDNKIKNINSYTSTQLHSFFTERYK